jgi:2-dehydropantoate 2-reductase
VIGLGPIGGILAAHLKAHGHSVCGIDARKDYIDAIQEKGISIKGYTLLQAKLDEAWTKLEDLKECKFDHVVVAVKTPYMEDVVKDLSLIKGNFQVISMQNGIDNEEFLARFFNRERVLRVAVNFAGNIISPGLINMTFFHKPNFVGCLCEEDVCADARTFATFMSEAGLETDAIAEIKKFTWRKTILVAALAPISALMGMTMAEVMSKGETHYVVEQLLREAIEVAKAEGYDYGDEFFEHCLDYLSTAGHHKPSMLIDIEKGNPTEIDYINGKISYYGHELNIPVTLNTTITSLIKAKEPELEKKA